ncbi:uncharacterized protein [Ptychodera flava]|uniref:uncharacterized protein n=1 Tax=Ptychodera flava TaxID=63121 RepID=UPI00396A39E5
MRTYVVVHSGSMAEGGYAGHEGRYAGFMQAIDERDAAVFRENEMDDKATAMLTSTDLKDFFPKAGPRLRVLRTLRLYYPDPDAEKEPCDQTVTLSTGTNSSTTQLCESSKAEQILPARSGQLTIKTVTQLGPELLIQSGVEPKMTSVEIDTDRLCIESRLYGRDCKSTDALKPYHKAMNEAAFELCVKDCSLPLRK